MASWRAAAPFPPVGALLAAPGRPAADRMCPMIYCDPPDHRETAVPPNRP
jgi:hypothetical protein